MAINKKLIFWNNQSNFSPPTSSTDTTKSVLWQSIVFFNDTKKIWTHGVYFSSPLDTLLSGYSVGTNTTLAASDTILGAFGKIQAQLNAKQVSLPDIPDLAGTYTKVTVSAKGLVTAGSNPTTLAGYGIIDAYTKTQINGFLYTDTRTITPTTWGTRSMQFGFTSLNLANGSPYADFIRFGGYQDSSGGRQNIILFSKNDFGIRQYQGDVAATTYNHGYVDYWHNGHFSSTNIANWNTAYSWGNHAGLYMPINGGTITRSDYSPLKLNSSFAAGGISLPLQKEGVAKANFVWWPIKGMYMQQGFSPYAMLGILDDTTPYYSPNNGITNHSLIHAGNIGSQSVNYATSAGSANSVANSLILKFDTGIVQGTDLYTFNGSAAKTIDFKAGSNVTLTKSSGSITISALDYMVGRNTVTTLASLPIDKRSVLANVTAATSLSLASTLPEGQILTIKVYNTSGLSITQPLPTESPFESKKIDGSNLSSIGIDVGGSVEISIWSINNKYIIKTDG